MPQKGTCQLVCAARSAAETYLHAAGPAGRCTWAQAHLGQTAQELQTARSLGMTMLWTPSSQTLTSRLKPLACTRIAGP